MTDIKNGRDIFAPAGLVEINGEEEAGFVVKQRVHTSNEGLSLRV